MGVSPRRPATVALCAVLLVLAAAACEGSSAADPPGPSALPTTPTPPTADSRPPLAGATSCDAILTRTKVAVASLHGLRTGAKPAKEAVPLVVTARDEVGVARFEAPTEQRPSLSQLYTSLSQLRSAVGAGGTEAIDTAIQDTATRLAAFRSACKGLDPGTAPPPGADKIEHVVFVVQTGRSFDHYFGSYPGADGAVTGSVDACIPNPATGSCSRPWHDSSTVDRGGPRSRASALADINGGAMDGFIRERQRTFAYCRQQSHADGAICRAEHRRPDVMGYHDAREIPNYWRYAQEYVLQDRLFAPNLGGEEATRLAMVSAWSAVCPEPARPNSCRPSLAPRSGTEAGLSPYAWTDFTHLLDRNEVSWGFYVAPGTPSTWNPLPKFAGVRDDRRLDGVRDHRQFFAAADAGDLPAVSWVTPAWDDSERAGADLRRGQKWVTSVVNAVMSGPDWGSTAIFVTWDGWGGFYDHVVPPTVDEAGYGIRVPGLMISPFARRGMVDHQTLSFDAYLAFVEDLFLDGARLDPFTNGRWDPRPVVREEAAGLGDVFAEFDFNQPPRKPVLLDTSPG